MQDPSSPSRSRSLSPRRPSDADNVGTPLGDSGYCSSSNTPASKLGFHPRQGSHSQASKAQLKASSAAGTDPYAQPDCIETQIPKKWFKRRQVQLQVYARDIPSSVQARFEDVRELLTRGLCQAIFSLKPRPSFSSIAMKLKVLGENEATAKPYIVFLCDEALKKEVHRYFEQSHVKAKYHASAVPADEISFGLAVCSRPPVFRATSDAVVSWSQETSRMTEGTLCGALIFTGKESEMTTATLGGVLDVQGFDGDWHKYGVTAAHLLRGRPADAEDWTHNNLAHGLNSEHADYDVDQVTAFDSYDLDIVLEAKEDEPHVRQKGPCEPLGTAFMETELASFLDLDFALIDFKNADAARPNVLVNWQLDNEAEPAKEIRMTDIHPLEGLFAAKPVLVLWNGENIEGTLTRDATSLLAGPWCSFVETFTLTLDQGRGTYAR